MPKTAKSQWDFGELFPAEPLRKVLSVAELTQRIRRLLEGEVGAIWVTGEVTNLRAQSSGHIYFTLKDANAQLSCVLFRGETQVDRALIQDGRKLILRGEVTVYEPRGQYQLRVLVAEAQGVGALQAAFEKLKQKLKTEGLFAQERKRPLPRFPQAIGLVTSPTGAAIRDVLHVVRRRNPALRIVLAPCRVQGEGAAAEIAAAIRLLNEFNRRLTSNPAPPVEIPPPPDAVSRLDLILVTRGGGSLEDLWAFNEEAVARAIFESDLPVVSAVGHEIDFTMSDFVADARAATPSAAAEILTEGVFGRCAFLAEVQSRLGQLTRRHLAEQLDRLTQAGQRLARNHPMRRLDKRFQELDELQARLQRCARNAAHKQWIAWGNLSGRLLRVRPSSLLRRRRERLEQIMTRLDTQLRSSVQNRTHRLGTAQSRLRLLGPGQVLARGYSITLDAATGSVLRAADSARPGQLLKTVLHSGIVASRVEQIPPAQEPKKEARG